MAEVPMCACGAVCGGEPEAPACPSAANSTPTEREAGDVGEVAAVLADHWPHPVFGCDCMPTDEETGQTGFLDGAWEAHVAAALAPLIAEREAVAHERGHVEGVEKGLMDPGSAWMRGNAQREAKAWDEGALWALADQGATVDVWLREAVARHNPLRAPETREDAL